MGRFRVPPRVERGTAFPSWPESSASLRRSIISPLNFPDRMALSIDDASRFLTEHAGTFFDPALTAYLFRSFRNARPLPAMAIATNPPAARTPRLSALCLRACNQLRRRRSHLAGDCFTADHPRDFLTANARQDLHGRRRSLAVLVLGHQEMMLGL